jgi:predicted TIM-barrel fold metal-dependent hydrolase
MPAQLGLAHPGFATLLALVREGNCWVKLSGAYRIAAKYPYAEAAPIAKALVESAPEHMVWGSDWPHPGIPVPGRSTAEITPFFQIDDGHVLNLLPTWVPDAATRKAILVENPERLYGF